MPAIRVPRSLVELSDVIGDLGTSRSPVDDGSGVFPLTEVPTQASLDAILDGVRHVDWRPLVLTRGLTPYGEGFADPAYRLNLNNVVHFQGMVRCTPPLSDDDAGRLLTTVAPDALPLGTLLFGCAAWQNNARIDVLPDGTVTFGGMLIGGGQIDWFTLTAIHYSVGAAA